MSGNPDPTGLEPETVEPRAPPITETQIRQTMRLSVLEGIPGICFLVGTGGSVLTGFALYLGATPFQIGLISSVPLLGQLLSPLVAWLAGRLGRRKPLTVILAVMGRVIWFPALILPALSPPEIRPILLLGVITLSSMFNSSVVVLWVSWMADVIPLKERGQFMGFRNGFLGVIGMGASLAAGAYLDRIASPADFQTVLGLATVLGIASALMLSGQTEPRISQARSNLKTTLIEPFADFFKRYGWNALLILSLIATYRISDIVMGIMANPFYVDMGYSKDEVAAVTKIYGVIMTLVGAFVGGVLSMRFGVMRTLMLGAVLSAASNLLFSWLSTRGHDVTGLTAVISVDNLASGIASSAFIAYMSSLTNISYSATQYALLSSMMLLLPKWLAGFSGVAVDAVGYNVFFIGTALIGVPVLVLIWIASKRLK